MLNNRKFCQKKLNFFSKIEIILERALSYYEKQFESKNIEAFDSKVLIW